MKLLSVDEKNEQEKEANKDWDKDRWKWPCPVESIRKSDTQRILAKVLEVMINVCF